MGRKAGGLYINPKKLGMTATSCSGEMVAFLGCLSQEKNIEHKCTKQNDRLLACVGSQNGKPKNPGNTINYHLQHLGRSKFL